MLYIFKVEMSYFLQTAFINSQYFKLYNQKKLLKGMDYNLTITHWSNTQNWYWIYLKEMCHSEQKVFFQSKLKTGIVRLSDVNIDQETYEEVRYNFE